MLIRIKRSTNSTPPSSLAAGELAWSEGSKTFYIGLISGGMLAIAGDGAGYLKENQNISITGDGTGSGRTAINFRLSNVVAAGTAPKVTWNEKGQVTGSAPLAIADLPPDIPLSTINGLQSALNSKVSLGGDGKIPAELLPPLATTEVFVVGSQAEMLALAAQRGDVVVRTDLSDDFILRGNDPSVLENWQKFLHPVSQTSGIVTVNGKTGSSVTIGAVDIPFQPVGLVTGVNVQAAIAQLDSLKLNKDATLTFSGDVSGSGKADGSIGLTLANIVAEGTAAKVRWNTKGQIVGSSALGVLDLPSEIPINLIANLQAILDQKVNSSDTIDGGVY